MGRKIGELAREFEEHAEQTFADASPLYAHLSRGIARDRKMLEIAARTREGQSAPLLLLGIVHYLLLKDERARRHSLGSFYPSIHRHAAPAEAAYTHLRTFCFKHEKEIADMLASRLVQTNEVRRCACLLPAFELAARRFDGRPLALVEIGASAGLNLLWDRYGYSYTGQGQYGDEGSLVQLSCELEGEAPPLPAELPGVATRVGLDVEPLDVHNAEQMMWLRAMIWPEQEERAELLSRAIRLARRDPPRLVAGDANEMLPGLLAEAPEDALLCVFHTFTTYELPEEERDRLMAIIREHGGRRDLAHISYEWHGGERSSLRLTTYSGGAPAEDLLAHCHPHGMRMEWLYRET